MFTRQTIADAVRTTLQDVGEGFFEITHNGLALVGIATVFAVATLAARPDLRIEGETRLMGWLQDRHAVTVAEVDEPELGAIDRATAADPRDLPRQQAAVAYWLSKKYRVAPEPLSALVAEAYETAGAAKLDPLLVLAVMAIESGFNPFAQSSVGAQGLMQVMTGIHSEKYDHFGGKLAAFDPVTNLKVGIKVLQECIQRAGSLDEGLKHYVGAANLDSDSGYALKVRAEHERLIRVASGRTVSPFLNVPLRPTAPPAIRAVAPATPAAEPVATPPAEVATAAQITS